VPKYGLTVAFNVLIESDARSSLCEHHLQCGLAVLQRIRPEVIAVQFDQVEGIEEYAFVVMAITNQIERSHAVFIAGDSFAIDYAGARAQASRDRQIAAVTRWLSSTDGTLD